MTDQISQLYATEHFFIPIQLDTIDRARTLLLSGDYQTCLNFIRMQPDGLVDDSTQLLVYKAAAMLFSEYAPEKINATLKQAESLDHKGINAGEIAAIRAIVCSYTRNPEEGIKQSKIALEMIRTDNTLFKNIIERNLGVAYTLKNDLENANLWFEKLLMSSFKLDDMGNILAAYNYLTYIRKVQGRLLEAKTIYHKALAFINEHNVEHMPHSIKIIAGYGHLLMYWHQLEEAKQFFHKAIQAVHQTDIIYAYTAYQHLCEAYIREQNLSAAKATLETLKSLVAGKEDFYEQIHHKQTRLLETRLLVEAGCFESAFQWIVENKFDDIAKEDLYRHFGYELGLILPLMSRIYIHMGMPDKAIEVLKAVIPQYIHQNANSYLIRALTALSVAYDQKGCQQAAINSLQKAIWLAKTEHNLGDFLLMGRMLIPILSTTLKIKSYAEFSNHLLEILQDQFPRNRKIRTIDHGHMTLSKREVDVLRLLAEGMSNREIAQALFLSCNTIKSHRTKIYRKLKVNSCGNAITKARQLGIIPTKTNVNQWSPVN